MKICINAGIKGSPARQEVSVYLCYGPDDRYEDRLLKRRISMDDGGQVCIDLDELRAAVAEKEAFLRKLGDMDGTPDGNRKVLWEKEWKDGE